MAGLSPVRADLSLGELQYLNLETLRAYSALPPDDRSALAERARQAAISAGAWIENPVDRDAAQSILDYWTAQVGSLPGHHLPELARIAPFERANGEKVRDQAARAFESLSEGPQAASRIMLLRLLGLHDLSIDKEANDADLAAAGGAFEKTGILRRTGDGELAVAHPALLKSYWAMMGAWLAEHDLEMAKVAAVTAGANAWDQAKRQDSYLPVGAKLTANATYRNSSDLVAAYIAAAERARVRRWIGLAVTVAGCAIVAAAIWWVRPMAKLTPEQTKAELSNVTGDQLSNLKEEVVTSDDPDGDDKVIVAKDEAITGYLWLGSSDVPMLRAVGGPKGADGQPMLVDPLTIKNDGSVYVVRTNVYLRDDFPTLPAYKSAPPRGVLDEGARVVLTGQIKGYQRPSGIQYWAQIRQIVRVSVQYDGGGERIATLMKQLLPSGFVLPPAQRLPLAHGMYKVIYYRDSDRAYADALMRRLVSMLGEGEPIKPKCEFRSNASNKAAVGVIEAWVDLDALPLRTVPSPVAESSVLKYCRAQPSPLAPPPAAVAS